ncbi:MAG: TMEM175 family protein [Promethearchaeati archaeon SRVP18_Atabeyarchaeia-1]
MNEERSSFRSRPRIQSLSDLIFGLALSIGALTLIGQQPTDFQNLLMSLGYYGLSFLILITVWRNYSNTMDLLPVENAGLVRLNIALLFLVSIEPYLFSQLFVSSTSAIRENVSVLYAIDLAGLYLILAFFNHSLVDEKKKLVPESLLPTYRHFRNIELLVSAIFLISIIPVFWSLGISVGNSFNNLRFILWILTLLLGAIPHGRRARQSKHQ